MCTAKLVQREIHYYAKTIITFLYTKLERCYAQKYNAFINNYGTMEYIKQTCILELHL